MEIEDKDYLNLKYEKSITDYLKKDGNFHISLKIHLLT